MTRVYISLGGNIDRRRRMRQAVSLLRRHFGRMSLSPVYESQAQGFVGRPFFNLAAGFDTGLGVAELAAVLTRIEKRCGRRRAGPRFGPRTADLDLLCYGRSVGSVAGIDLPRSELRHCDFVLRPLADIAAEDTDPLSGESWAGLWQKMRETQGAGSRLRRLRLRLSRSAGGHRPPAASAR